MHPSSEPLGRCTMPIESREQPDLLVHDVTLPCVSDLTSSRCQCLTPSQGECFSHETIRRSTGRRDRVRTGDLVFPEHAR